MTSNERWLGRAMDVVSQALDEGNAKITLEIGKSLGLLAPVHLPEGPETIERLEEHRTALRRAASQVAADT